MSRQYVLTERDYQRLSRLVKAYEAGELKPRGERQQIGLPRDKSVVRVTNASGATLEKGSVVELTEYELGDNELQEDNFWFTADESTGKAKWGVLLHAVPNGGEATCQVSGVCVARVNITDTAHEFARVESGQTELQSAESGPVLILHHNGTEESQLCPVVIRGESGERHWLLKADANVAPGTSGTFSIWSGTPGSETDTTEDLTFFNRTGLQIDSGKWAKGLTINGERYAEPWECPAGGA